MRPGQAPVQPACAAVGCLLRRCRFKMCHPILNTSMSVFRVKLGAASHHARGSNVLNVLNENQQMVHISLPL